jgi:hypothetical protein
MIRELVNSICWLVLLSVGLFVALLFVRLFWESVTHWHVR